MSASVNRTANGQQKANGKSYGEAQTRFIEKTRAAINLDTRFFEKHDWKRITLLGGKQPRGTTLNTAATTCVSVESFYVKDLAVWVPHLIVPNHMPTCPHCKKNSHVQPTGTWVARPKVLYGIRKHRYLDTKYYKCHAASCGGRQFSGTNQQSMELDGPKIIGIFNFHVSAGYAVDEELYSYIVNHSKETTASIYRGLAQMACDEWCDDAFYYYRAVKANKVKRHHGEARLSDSRQRTLDSHLVPRNESVEAKQLRNLMLELARVKRQLTGKKQALENDFEFISVFHLKKNRNGVNLPFKGIGRGKLLKLIELGITTARELLDYDGGNPAVLPQWRRIVADYYKQLEREVVVLENRVSKLEDDLEWNALALDIAADPNNEGIANANTTAPPGEKKMPPFSPLTDSERYNARVLSKSAIDRIIVTDFQRRKPLQEDMMRSIKAQVLKIDWHYKLASKIKVYTGRGKSFTPFKSCVSIQNEDAQTLFWKCYPCSEGVDAMRDDLMRLKDRFMIIQNALPKVAYVDNCCSVRPKLQDIFGAEFLVLLDCFHWCKRWDAILYDTMSAEASIFRGLIHNALFVVENTEFERAKFVLRGKLGRNPSNKEVLKEAKATIPDPDSLEQRIKAVIQYVSFSDLSQQMPLANEQEGESRKQFFKTNMAEVQRVIKNQMTHVTKGCLSDPDRSVVRIHRINPVSQEGFSARSTGTNENDNMFLNRLLNTPSVGIPRAERVMYDHYEISNIRRRVKRLGEPEPITHRQEKLFALNSTAVSCGYSGDELPVKEPVAIPRNISELKEYLGMQYSLLPGFLLETDGVTDADMEDLANFLTGGDFEEEDIPVDATQFEIDHHVEPTPLNNDGDTLQRCLDIHLPQIKPNETTFEAFKRMTSERPWVPFQKPTEPKSELDNEEYSLFARMETQYDRHGSYLNSRRGYGSFASAWDLEVANRFKAKAAGDNTVVLIHRKSVVQLQRHYDALKIAGDHAAHMRPNDTQRTQMEAVLRRTRRDMPQRQQAYLCQPQTYSQVGQPCFGNPLPLNTAVAAAAFVYNRNAHPNTPFALRPIHNNPSRVLLGSSFNQNKYCWRCGFQRKQHSDYGVPFGTDCRDNCQREDCSKCGERAEFHGPGVAMGPTCTKPAHSTSPYHDWYKQNRNNNNRNTQLTDATRII